MTPRRLAPAQYFVPKTLASLPWVYYAFSVRPTDKTVKVKARKVAVLCPIPEAAELGIGAMDDEIVEKAKLPEAERKFQAMMAGKKVTDAERVSFFFTFGSNLNSGVTMIDSLVRGLGAVKSPYLRGVIASVIFYLKTVDGSSLSRVMGMFPDAFDELTVSLLVAGEASGELPKTVMRIHDMMKENMKLRRKATSVLVYPMIVVGLLFIVVYGIGFFVVPKLMPVFKQMLPTGLPTSTKILFAASDMVRGSLMWLPVIGFGLHWLWKRKKVLTSTPWYQRTVLTIPTVGRLVFLFITIRTLRVFAQLLRSGVPAPKMYDTVARVSDNVVFSDFFRAVYARLRSGRDPGSSFFAERHRLGEVGTDVAQAMRIGEATGDPAAALEQRIEIYDAELSNMVEKLPNIINVIMLGALAPCLVILALGVIEPSLKMGQDVHQKPNHAQKAK